MLEKLQPKINDLKDKVNASGLTDAKKHEIKNKFSLLESVIETKEKELNEYGSNYTRNPLTRGILNRGIGRNRRGNYPMNYLYRSNGYSRRNMNRGNGYSRRNMNRGNVYNRRNMNSRRSYGWLNYSNPNYSNPLGRRTGGTRRNRRSRR
jgi:hypothetical protein